ncbi:DMT family transporter [Leptolyngbya sp. FACHB-261]|uniref:DMT family transporter n=1 Tax=Leptolyngbya sp. FACHB-261 TaxID=2692806 RepID=UPI001686590B|nr:DMT family transporter [Leptolyngbya sp. FACHB-261]MBD2099653.1 DMT family transporter [Leptolyngbya sp. FACHB-261]
MKPIDLARLFLLAALWGGSYLFIRVAAPVLGIFLTMSLRVLLAASALSLYGAFIQQLPNFRKRWRAYLLLGLLNNVIPFILIAVAVVNLNASIAATLNATTPLFTAIVAALWIKEPLNWQKVVGLLLGISGVAILVGWSPLLLSPSVILGGIFALVAAFSYGIAAVYARRTFLNNKPTDTATGQLIGSSVLLLPALLISAPSTIPSAAIILAVVALALACTSLAYLLYFQLISSAGATRAATVTFLIPAFSILFGKVFLAEPINSGLIIGLIMILLSVWLVTASKS